MKIFSSIIYFILIIILTSEPGFSQQEYLIYPTKFSDRINSNHSPFNQPKIGLVLSGGGARGLAQIGVLKSLEKHGINIDLIVGNSLGSVVGGLYASGYTTTEIESIALHTDWAELLSFTEETKRSDLFVGQKQSQQEGYFSIRFDGLEPIIPSSISGGQRLLNFFSYLALQSIYHPDPSFDDLKIPFRAVATDLISGKRIILDRGSLAEALRASVTVPLLYSPIQKDSMVMVDGGLRSNIPVDVARAEGCDVVIVVNSTSSMRNQEQMKAPWEIADQIMTIMMQESNREQLKLADIVIKPQTRERIVSDFSNLDSLIAEGERSADKSIDEIYRLIGEKSSQRNYLSDTIFKNIIFSSNDQEILKEIKIFFDKNGKDGTLSVSDVHRFIDSVSYELKNSDLKAIIKTTWDSTFIDINLLRKMIIKEIRFSGNTLLSDSIIKNCTKDCIGHTLSDSIVIKSKERLLHRYRSLGYSLVKIDSVNINDDGVLSFIINQGVIGGIEYNGNTRTRDYIIRREFPLEIGDVFNIDKAVKGIVNIKSSGLFEYVFMDVKYVDNSPVIILNVKEQSSELIRIGFNADNEHGIVATVGSRDGNFRGAWEELGMVLRYGYRDWFAKAEYTVNRIFHSYFTFNLKAYTTSRDVFTYAYTNETSSERWERIEQGRYRDARQGALLMFGSHVSRLGNLTTTLRWEKQKIHSISGDGYSPLSQRFVSIKFQSTIDTEDKYSFPTKGLMFVITFESASKKIGSEVGFGKIGIVYENYFTAFSQHTLKAKITFGFADQTLPITEQYSLGGFQSFLGLREDDSRGRQVFLGNLEYRLRFPFKLIFDTYLKLRYDLGTISLVPEELKFSNFRHGLGVEIALDTPLGPASFGAGQSFFIRKNLPNSPVAVGPVLFYFSIGPSL
ncbi:MAG: patatin-like phospholipase family protein [Ignavibacteriales bacterium]|nr:patatin-like phospholipase family protein [Ignavibacteriales bacterium]